MHSIITGLNRSGKLRLCALAASLAILAAACDKMPLLAPRESTIKLSTASTVVQANGTTEIRATVLGVERNARAERHDCYVHDNSRGAFSRRCTHEQRHGDRAVSRQWPVGQSVDSRRFRRRGIRCARDFPSVRQQSSRIGVTANPNQVASGGRSTITATVTDA